MSQEIIGNSVLIIGNGKEGQSVIKFLTTNKPGISITVADKNPLSVKNLKVSTTTGKKYLANINNFDTVVRSPSIPKTTPELSLARHLTSATNIFFSECPGMIIGVTGTKGKSTTSSLIHHILATSKKDVRLVGNIGRPALDNLKKATKNTLFVCELSSYQLDDIRYSPHIAVILPISPEHLNYHGSYNTYLAAKSHIIDKQGKSDYVVFFSNNNLSSKIAKKSSGHHVPYPNKNPELAGVWFENECIWYKTKTGNSGVLIPRAEIPLLGTANVENCMAAATVALLMKIKPTFIRKAIKSFKPLEHRLEPIGKHKGIYFFNDSLATTPVATIHALEALKNNVITLIAGGYDRGLEFNQLGKTIANSAIKNVILLPDTGNKIAKEITKFTKKIRIIHVTSMKNAVKESYINTPAGGTCLMSPAAASFNLFKDYADRGNAFKHWVNFYGKTEQISYSHSVVPGGLAVKS